MLTSAFKKLVGSAAGFDSYTLLRLQAKSYRLIKNHVAIVLDQYKFSTLDWSLFGILVKNPAGVRFIHLSQEMGVEPPFVTELVNILKKKEYLKIEEDPNDRRAKCILLTKKSEELIPMIEKEIKTVLSDLLLGVSTSEFKAYQSTIEKMLANLNKRTGH